MAHSTLPATDFFRTWTNKYKKLEWMPFLKEGENAESAMWFISPKQDEDIFDDAHRDSRKLEHTLPYGIKNHVSSNIPRVYVRYDGAPSDHHTYKRSSVSSGSYRGRSSSNGSVGERGWKRYSR